MAVNISRSRQKEVGKRNLSELTVNYVWDKNKTPQKFTKILQIFYINVT